SVLLTVHQPAFLYRAVFSSNAGTGGNGSGRAVARSTHSRRSDSPKPAGQRAAVDPVDVRHWPVFYAAGHNSDGVVWLEFVCRATVLFGVVCGTAAQLSRAAGVRDVHERGAVAGGAGGSFASGS